LICSYNGGALADSLKIAGLAKTGAKRMLNRTDFEKWIRINPESKVKAADSIIESRNRKASECRWFLTGSLSFDLL